MTRQGTEETRMGNALSWRSLAVKNTVQTFRRYLGYIISTSIAVMVVFMFSAFIANPAVAHGSMTHTARQILLGCEIVILLFAAFFVYFFHSALLRTRSKEFALFMTLGMRSRQIGRMILWEGWAIGILALALGGAFGLVFLKLFLMGIGHILSLSQTIPFMIPRDALWVVGVVFGAYFLLDGIIQSWRIRRRTLRALLFAANARQKAPKPRLWLVILALGCLGLAYYLALGESMQVVRNFFPILILTTVGTYFLFSQVSVFVLQAVRRRPRAGKTMLLAGRLSQRIRDNALILTVVAQLSAMVLSGMGAVFGTSSLGNQNSLRIAPYSIMVAQSKAADTASAAKGGRNSAGDRNSTAQGSILSSARMKQLIQQHGVTVTGHTQVRALTGQFYYDSGGKPTGSTAQTGSNATPGGSGNSTSGNWGNSLECMVLSTAEYQDLRTEILRKQPSLRRYLTDDVHPAAGHAVFVAPYPLMMGQLFTNHRAALRLDSADSTVKLTVDKQIDATVIDMPAVIGVPPYLVIVPNASFANLEKIANIAGNPAWQIDGFMLSNWKQANSAAQAVDKALPAHHRGSVAAPSIEEQQTQQMLSMMSFAGFFVSLLFFLACGSSLYFRLQSQQEGDERQFHALYRVGMRVREMRGVLTAELAISFFAPILVAVMHSVFAIGALTHLLNIPGNIWPMFCVVVAVYVASIAVYFTVARFRYASKVVRTLG